MDHAESETAGVVATHSGHLAFPLDILLLIVQDLEIEDILTLGQVCHIFTLAVHHADSFISAASTFTSLRTPALSGMQSSRLG